MTANASPKSFSLTRVLLILAPLVILGGGAAYWYQTKLESVAPVDRSLYLARGLKVPAALAKEFTDKNEDLIADAPEDKAQWLDPKILKFATLGPNLENEQREWKDFLVHLEKATGRKVEMAEPTEESGECLVDMRTGDLHIMGLSTGAVPIAVNVAGFVPAFVMADSSGKFGYQMEVLVPAGSAVKNLADLRGKKLAFGRISSFSSCRVPIALLWGEHQLLAGRDFDYIHATSQGELIREVAKGKFDAVAVAGDYLARLVSKGDVDSAKFRSIHKSPTYPPACFGYSHQLHPDLAAKIKEAFTSFAWQDSSLAKAYAAANQTCFVAIDYKKDWQSVRNLDAELAKMIDAQGKIGGRK